VTEMGILTPIYSSLLKIYKSWMCRYCVHVFIWVGPLSEIWVVKQPKPKKSPSFLILDIYLFTRGSFAVERLNTDHSRRTFLVLYSAIILTAAADDMITCWC
jgi:hypothetical protein